MAELKRYFLDKETLKKKCDELIEFAYSERPTSIRLQVRASVDEVATYNLAINGNIVKEGNLNG